MITHRRGCYFTTNPTSFPGTNTVFTTVLPSSLSFPDGADRPVS